MAVLKRSEPAIQKLIEYGVDVNSTNSKGSTALETAKRLAVEDIADLLLELGADSNLVRSIELHGKYMGQTPPDSIPAIFAPSFISTEEYEFGSVFNALGTEFYYGVDVGSNTEIRFTQVNKQGKWSKPEVLLSHEEYGYNDPFLSPDEQRLYFISQRALDGVGPLKDDHDIWYIERTKDGWSAPINAGTNINSVDTEYYISFTKTGTMYFASDVHATDQLKKYDFDIQYATYKDGVFQKPVPLGEAINTRGYEADVFIDPAEQYLIFCSTRAGGFGRGDLYISFKKLDGSWTKSVNMGLPINSKHHELCPFVSADGKYLFYTSNEDIYWVSTKVIDRLRGNR